MAVIFAAEPVFMKTLSTLILILTLAVGCKKQAPTYFCKNTCYTCYKANNYTDSHDRCNTDYLPEEFEIYLMDDSLFGYICKEKEPTIYREYEGELKDIGAQIDSEKAARLSCYEKGAYQPQYFNYTAFAAHNQKCEECYDSITKHFLHYYLDTVEVLTGFCGNCVSDAFVADTLPGLIAYASQKVSAMHCGAANGNKYRINSYISTYIRNQIYDTALSQSERENWIALNNWFDFNPVMTPYPAIYSDCP